MTKRRMFSQSIVENDVFLDMPLSTQALYFHLGMNADDDGFVSPKRVMRMVGANNDDLQILLAKRYVLTFPSGVVVIKHWLLNNFIRTDRYAKTTYASEMASLTKNEYGAYTEIDRITTVAHELTEVVNQRSTVGIPNDIPTVDPDKVRLDKVSNSTNVLVDSAEAGPRTMTRKDFFYKLVEDLGFTNQVMYTDGRKQKLNTRLRSFKPADLVTSARNLGADAYMQGDNPAGKRYGTIDYLLRCDENVDKYLNDSNNTVAAGLGDFDESKYI